MPFTPSHAIVALPFGRTPLAPAAVAVGAMAPDLPLFLRGTAIDYGWTHDPAWAPATVLLALALLLLWRGVLRPAMRELTPTALGRRLPSDWDCGAAAAVRETFARPRRPRPSLGGVLLLIVGLTLGVLSHLVWDAFSHEGRTGVLLLPALDAAWGPLPGYKWVQHGSSIIGVVVLAVWALWWLRRARPTPVQRTMPTWASWAWLGALPAVLLIAWCAGLAIYGPLSEQFTVQHLAYRVLPPACGLWGFGTLVVCAITQLRRRRA